MTHILQRVNAYLKILDPQLEHVQLMIELLEFAERRKHERRSIVSVKNEITYIL